jgi:hypothetical protein
MELKMDHGETKVYAGVQAGAGAREESNECIRPLSGGRGGLPRFCDSASAGELKAVPNKKLDQFNG